MAKLFALEEAEVSANDVELEATPEAGEVADAQVDVESDINEMNEVASGIEEGIGAADQLEDVKEVVEDAAENGGLDPVAAEAVRIAVEAICARVGANPKSIYPLYAIENFTSKSSRRANTYYALEGVGEFLKELWSRIKAALVNLWNKIKEFWKKHFSTLGRTLKALESMKKKVSEMKGVPSYEQIEVPSSLKSIFPVKNVLGVDEIERYAETLDDAKNKLFNNFRILNDMAKQTGLQNLLSVLDFFLRNKNGLKIEFGNEKNPMPGGTYHSWEFELEAEVEEDFVIYTLNVDENSDKYTDGNNNATLEVANKEKLKALINETIQRCKQLIKDRDNAEKRASQTLKNLQAIDKAINNIAEHKSAVASSNSVTLLGKETAKILKHALRVYNLIMSKGPMIESKFVSYCILYFRGVLMYCSACIKNTKTA